MKRYILLIAICLFISICGCGGKLQTIRVDIKEQDQCVPEPFIRNIYFEGQLLAANDFQDEQDYHIGKQNLHNRFLHGWGVVCGLWVMPSAEYDDRVILTSGIGIDCEGREIIISKPISVPLGSYKTDIYIAIEYKPLLTGFVPDLNEQSKQATKFEESFDFTILQDLPDGYESTKDLIEGAKDKDIMGVISRNHSFCCSKSMPIVLAKININDGKIKEGDIDNVSYRRLVLNSSDIAILLSNISRRK